MSQQKALWLKAPRGEYEVGPKDIQKPGPGQLLVKVVATALNPVDWKIRDYDFFIQEYPAVLGSDSAGTVEEIGEGVQGFSKGDRVVHQGFFDNSTATFQQYSIVPAEIVAKIPENITFDQAASIPVGAVTAFTGLYNDPAGKGLGLLAPWKEGGKQKYAGTPLFINGGATSVGQYTIQIAKLSGFSPIITTASLSNKDLLISLGATHVINRHISASALAGEVEKIAAAVDIAYDTVSTAETQQATYDLLAPGGKLVVTLAPVFKVKEGKNVTVAAVFGSSHDPAVRAIAASFFSKLTEFLRDGSIKPNKVEVLPNGLAGIVDGLERLRVGVSGLKLIGRPQETA